MSNANNGTLPAPSSRTDLFLAHIAGEEVELPEAVSREEQYLAHIAEHEAALEASIGDLADLKNN